jgi:hypothetical protein
MSILDQLLDEFYKHKNYTILLKTYSENCNDIVMYEQAIEELKNAIEKLEKLGMNRDIEHLDIE